MTEPDTSPPDGPYAAAAAAYWAAGWRGLLPLPPKQKAPVPNGWTGARGEWPSRADVQAWIEDRPDANLALRLPPGVIGIDVDHYDSKPGGLVFTQLETTLGALPATWRTTSRDDGVSGIRLYRIPEGLRWPGGLGPGIDTIRVDHRYAVAWPSIHPNGGTYRWITPDGATALGVVPNVDDLPDLPDTWVAHFTRGELAADQPHANLTDAAAGQWLTERGKGQPCRHMRTALDRATADLTVATSRHDATLSATNRLVWLAGEGHTGAAAALHELRAAFLKAMAGDRSDGVEGEWDRMVTGAVRIAAAAHPNPSPDPCDDPFHGLIPATRKDNPWTASPSPTSTSPSATAATSTSSTSSTSASSETAPQATASATASTTSPTDADDLTETQIRRNQAAAAELERLRAQRQAQRLLEREDEDSFIADRVWRRILDDKAAIEYKRQTEPPAPPFDAGTLADVLARPADPPMRVAGLIPWAASALVVAQRKTGKTTLLLNYARALITGEKFLGEFDVIALPHDARVAFLNYEVSAAQLARWAHEAGIPEDRLYLVNLRGRRNPLGNPDDRALLAKALVDANVHAVIVDPFGRAYTGVSQNDNGEVQAFLVGLEEFVRSDVGALDLMLATHAGWDGERTRGASALEDWGDVIITLTRDADEEERRFMKAMGRDVDVDEDELVMDENRSLVRTGNGSRREQKGDRESARLAVYVVRAARENPGCSKSKLIEAMREMSDAPSLGKSSRTDLKVKEAIGYAEKAGQLRVEKGSRGTPDRHFEASESTSYPQPPPPPPNHRTAVPHRTTAAPVYGAVVGGGGPERHSSTTKGGGGPDTEARVVERTVAGERYRVNLDTGDMEPV
jgi:hypothetical protein